MKAWKQTATGPIEEKLKLVDNAARPNAALKNGEILVRVISAGHNPADYKVIEMGLISRVAVKFPKVAGMDLSGAVVAVAEGLSDVKVGDNILGRIEPSKQYGSLSQYVVLPRDGYAVLPSGVDPDYAAGVPTAGLTAYQSIKPYVKSGDHVFINGGSGGTGTFGIQIAKALGCHITTSCSTAKVVLVKKLGADAGQVYDLVVDNVDNSPEEFFSKTPKFLKPEGYYIGVGGSASLTTAKNIANGLLRPTLLGGTPRKFVPYFTKNVHEDYEQLAKWLADGTMTTIIESTCEFEQAIEALKYLKKGSSAGKVIVHVSPKV
ncbi:chaperonin 10-like protein [Aspergillus caelatus]|uniref:Chaperonin 10-like protein n=1 Tax=Aspergillus caelatus TaxID=61420 RepID=A0A5N6ZRZ4_9EURO|nr:chaperonin 10-like protein [Aspergillus caelatus]KAE8360401.1 chaperonin 10-like protein [Aspergillus caelatus]